MRRTAGTAVYTRDRHDSHFSRQFLLAAIFQRCKLLRGGKRNFHRQIGTHRLICLCFDGSDFFFAQFPVKVNGEVTLAHVKADVLTAVKPVCGSGEDVLARVVLHPAEPQFPVDPSVHRRSLCQRAVAKMYDLPVLLVRVQNLHAAQASPVGSLAAALREERGLVQYDLPAALVLFTAQYPRREVKKMAVGVIELLRHVRAPE